MKTFAAILFLAVGFFVNSSAQTTNSIPVSPGSLEIVLNLNVVAFNAVTTNIMMEVTFRNLGEIDMTRPDLMFALTVIWDGKEYKGTHELELGFTGSPEFPPKATCRFTLPLLHYGIPSEALASGRHTIAVKEAEMESNTLTVFVETRK